MGVIFNMSSYRFNISVFLVLEMEINMRNFNQFFIIVFVVFCSGKALAFEKVSVGSTMYNACKSLHVHEKPTAFSKKVKTITFGKQIEVKGLERQFELPDSDFSSKKSLTLKEESDASGADRDAQPIDPKEYTRAAWVKIGAGQFVSNSCLVSKGNLDGQDEKVASEKVEKIASGKAKRNFSEDESGDMTAMRGAAGKAKGGPADYAKIDKFINNSQGIVDLNNLIEFRKVGKLGEFK